MGRPGKLTGRREELIADYMAGILTWEQLEEKYGVVSSTIARYVRGLPRPSRLAANAPEAAAAKRAEKKAQQALKDDLSRWRSRARKCEKDKQALLEQMATEITIRDAKIAHLEAQLYQR